VADLNDCILVVEDDSIIARIFVLELRSMGQSVCATCDTARKAIALATQHRPRLVLMDNRLKGKEDGVTAALAIHADVGSKVIFVTGSRDPQTCSPHCRRSRDRRAVQAALRWPITQSR
jgi:CheY-like chemotaxis protein